MIRHTEELQFRGRCVIKSVTRSAG